MSRDFIKELEGIGIDPSADQGTDFWHKLRLGVVTASKASCLLSKPTTATYTTYLLENCSEICTKKNHSTGSAKPMEWGNKYEREAREVYEFKFLTHVKEVPFIYKDKERRFGCSPDGLVVGQDKGVEIKCPYNTKNHIDFIVNGEIKKEYLLQCQFSMWITGFQEWDFVSYDPRMIKNKIHVVTIKRCEKVMEKFDEASIVYKEKTDEALSALGFEFGEQWVGFEKGQENKKEPEEQTQTYQDFDLDSPF